MSKQLSFIKDDTLQFLSMFSNADQFYVSARQNLKYGFLTAGCVNAQQAIELYIKAILYRDGNRPTGHDLVRILEINKNKYEYFSTILSDSLKTELLKALCDAYLSQRYGEVGSISNSRDIIKIVDELVYYLRTTYIKNIKAQSSKLYVPTELKECFLVDNIFFSDQDITNKSIFSIIPSFGL